MLYFDHKIKLPLVMPSPDFTLRFQSYKGTYQREGNSDYQASAVLYTGRSRRDPLTRKMVHAPRYTIGKLVIVEGKEYLVPNEHYFEFFTAAKQPPELAAVQGQGSCAAPTAVDSNGDNNCNTGPYSGFYVAWQHVTTELGLVPILEDIFGVERARTLLTMAAFYAFAGSHDLPSLSCFARTHMGSTAENLDVKSAGGIFAGITAEEQTAFLRQWLALQAGNDTGNDSCFYDIATIGSIDDSLLQHAWFYGDEIPQPHLGLFVSTQSSLPLCYCTYYTSRNDLNVLPDVISEASSLGLNGHITLVSDELCTAEQYAETAKLYAQHYGYGLLGCIPQQQHPEVSSLLLEWQKNPNLHDEMAVSPRYFQISTPCAYTLNESGISGTLYMYNDRNAMSQEDSAIYRVVKAVNNAISTQGTLITPYVSSIVQRLFAVEPIAEKGQPLQYRITPDNNKLRAALIICGCSALFTTEESLGALDCIERYQAKSVYEQRFAYLTTDHSGECLLIHRDQKWQGKLLVLFLALIGESYLKQELSLWIMANLTSLEAAMHELADLKCYPNGTRWYIKEPLSPVQLEIVKKLKLPLDIVQSDKQ